jgi:hypothetical protein
LSSSSFSLARPGFFSTIQRHDEKVAPDAERQHFTTRYRSMSCGPVSSTSVQAEPAVCPLTGCARDAKNSTMKDAVQRLNLEYGLNLSDDEIEQIAKQAEAGQRLFQKLFEVDVEGVAPTLKIDLTEKR